MIGQGLSDIRIVDGKLSSENKCYEIQLKYSGEDATLASQNYRIFYDAEVSQFIASESKILISGEEYSFNVVQHREGVDASGVGALEFEGNLGFINATVILHDTRSGGHPLVKDGKWSPIVQICFSQLTSNDPSIILAREELTSSYGRAFVELSQLSADGKISSLPISSYGDYK